MADDRGRQLYYRSMNEQTPRGPANKPFYGTLGLNFVDPDERQGYGTNTSDYVQQNGQLMYRLGDPGALQNSWVPPWVRESLQYDPTYGYLLSPEAASAYQDPIRATAAKDDAKNAMHFGLAAMLMGGLPMAAHGAFGATAQGLTGGTEGLGATESVGSGSVGGGDMSFFDDILGGWGTNEEALLGGWGTDEAALLGGELPGGMGGYELPGGLGGLFDSSGSLPTGTTDWIKKLLLGSNPNGSTKGLADLFGNQGLLGAGLGALPGIAALSYAQNQGTPDLSQLQNAYSNVSPAALAGQFDLNTGLGRERLTSGLERRGVAGSSFGNADLTNFDTARDIGRSQLLTQGAGMQADIASKIVNAQLAAQKAKNDLYGRALLAISGGLTPQRNALFSAGGLGI